jgi:succinate dehydrogenase / fumarate reductase membrane anchor subunit
MSWRAQGMRTWLLQRLTAVYMLLFAIGFTIFLLNHTVHDHAAWRSVFTHPLTNICTAFFFFSVLYHAWVGMRDILIDYIKLPVLRFIAWTLVTVLLTAMGVWVSMILYSVVQV